MQPKNIGTEKAIQKIRQYCAYQERNHREVKEKLYSFGLYKADVDEILTQMIDENYLNEERYAIAFAGGKFRIKNWGKVKIRYALKQSGISEYCIKKALAAVEETDYLAKLQQLFTIRQNQLRSEKNMFNRKKKLRDYLLQKGFESDLIMELLHNK